MNQSTLAAQLTVIDLFDKQVALNGDAPALSQDHRTLTYAELATRTWRWAALLHARGLRRGDRIAMLAENRIEYIELQLAAARLGIIIACLNWRLAGVEQLHCIRLVAPSLIVVSARHRAHLDELQHGVEQVIDLDTLDELPSASAAPEYTPTDPEDGLLILYTSGTTGLPKGAVISQRASVARAMIFAADYGILPEDGFIAWSPFFHMAATDHSLATLMLGGHVIVLDGYSAPAICQVLARERIGWLLLMPGAIAPLIDLLESMPEGACQARIVGAMADLVPPQQIADITRLLDAPYLNTFGSTETGLPPASGALLPAATPPTSLAKRESGWCALRLVDTADNDVPTGTPGNLLIRGPSLFSGYWREGRIDDGDLANGWFRMGDIFVRHADGSLDFIDRSKYLIKSGGENIYPAEIERVLLAHPAVAEVAVVRQRDDQWGEVPVAFVALRDPRTTGEDLQNLCRDHLARYKVPKEIRIIDVDQFPKNSTGKIIKKNVEAMLHIP